MPPEGGAFYHPETIDSAKLHYKKSWPSIIHALSVWLKETDFSHVTADRNIDSEDRKMGSFSRKPANVPANMKPEEINSDRLYLILGKTVDICFKGMCG